jgi:hypothetical protein
VIDGRLLGDVSFRYSASSRTIFSARVVIEFVATED